VQRDEKGTNPNGLVWEQILENCEVTELFRYLN